MKKKSTLKIFAAVFCIASSHAFSGTIPIPKLNENLNRVGFKTPIPPGVYDLDPLITISQNVNEKGLVLMSGKLSKPFTDNNILLSVKYQNTQGEWITGWCKTLYSYNQYNENLKATFELPPSTSTVYNLKVELSSDSSTANFSSVIWDKTTSHYKQGDYAPGNCDLDENEYTMLLTPKKAGTLITDTNGKATGIKDRVTSAYSWNKLSNVLMDNKKNDIVFSPTNPSDIITDSNGNKSVKMVNTGAIGNTLGSTPEFIYNEAAGHPIPYLYSYDDPVYMFAGKFSANGFFMKFSQWPGDSDGPGYYNFKDPNKVESRYFNLYNRTWKNLSEFIPDQQPVVIVSSLATGLRAYKSDGTYINLTPNSTSNYGDPYFGYTNGQGVRRGPGSENLLISDTSEMTLYGAGALRNDATSSYQTKRSLQDIEREVSRFIKYTGVFGDTTAYKNDASECSVSCFTINSGAQPDVVADWTKAPNSYIFTGKDKNGNSVDGLYIPVKKAYEMWAKGGDFMKDDNGNYTKIPQGVAKAGLYWEDEPGLIKSVTLEGTEENARIKVIINKIKEGNAAISYKVNDKIYWTWHVWATDDPGINGSTYHHGFEKDKEGTVVTDWKWMDRNLGATNASFVGNDWHKSAGLQYQWGRKDPFPSFGLKDLSLYPINGEINLAYTDPAFQSKFIKVRGNKYSSQINTGTDTPNGNIRFSIQNPINFIATPVYVAKKGEALLNDGEDFLKQNNNDSWTQVGITTWFSKEKYKKFIPPYRENITAWDLWGDTRQGNYSDMDDPAVGEASTRYALKSPYDPCPCNWRVPSSYFSGGRNSSTPMPDENRYSPWGKHTGSTANPEFNGTALNADYPGIKIYPQFGFDFSGVSGMNLGKFPINGNYEAYPNGTSPLKYGAGWITPVLNFQDQSADGGLLTTTFITASEMINQVRYPSFGAAGLALISDPLSGSKPRPGWHRFSGSSYSSSGGVRCIYDPNNSFMPKAFETEFVSSSSEAYSTETLKSWSKLPNSYVEYTNPTLVTPNPNGNKVDPNKDNDRIIEIPLRKAYAMHKLHLSTDFSFPAESTKSSSVVWTNNTSLIQKMEIVDGSIDTAILKVTLNSNATGNAVVAFHVGSGTWTANKHNDPVVWSWHIWAPRSVIETYTFDPENASNGGVITTNDQFVDPMTSAGVPMKTTFMDRDLGAKLPFINEHIYGYNTSAYTGPLGSYNNNNPAAVARLDQMHDSGGLHFQWGRKDPLPVFYNPGMFYNHFVANKRPFNDYFVYRQNNPANATTGAIPYANNMLEPEYLTSYTQPYTTYSATANVSASDSKADKLKKVVKYSVTNPLIYLYQSDATKLDWVSDENGNMPERWGHATEKSAYDPCPAGWRIVDMESVSTGVILGNLISKGNTPWFYNAKFTNSYGLDPGKDNTYVNNESYDINKMNYVGSFVYGNASGMGSFRYGFILNKPEYNIGTFPNNGIRGFNGGNTLDASKLGGNPDTFMKSGIWTAANQGGAGSSLGMLFNAVITQTVGANDKLYYLTPTFGFRPQAAMSCRCAEIKYDANGNEIGRYEPFAIPVPKNALAKAKGVLAKSVIVEKVAQNKLEFFPNPVKNMLYIKGNDRAKDYYYQIYNMSGQIIQSGKFENERTDLSSLISGAYLVRINNSETVVKIIKE
ncbi:putative secreted protein (Por secretion system target) [Chryseobacterium sp. 52]|uniref:T9SS type A sorting domain-containing protein n=1 Tax=Chryseobacterium sp. 52 TaxID=2035213 RepID=UPI000C4A9461|nr:T9SS type A sorting domain-containing protein [Chryseobacterium sp. 52]PIF43447.1 putative secreted protein (Por secretion system target) [Chryseobacterium sp. 52]